MGTKALDVLKRLAGVKVGHVISYTCYSLRETLLLAWIARYIVDDS
jgi:hypothetical protein